MKRILLTLIVTTLFVACQSNNNSASENDDIDFETALKANHPEKLQLIYLPLPLSDIPYGGLHNDELDLLVDPKTPSEELEDLYKKICLQDFHKIAPKLVDYLARYSTQFNWGVLPQSKEPWSDPKIKMLSLKKYLTLGLIWYYHSKKQDKYSIFETMMKILESKKSKWARQSAVSSVYSLLHNSKNYQKGYKGFPPIAQTIQRLENIVKNTKESVTLRRFALPILIEHGDPNNYIELFIEIANAETNKGVRCENIRWMIRPLDEKKLNRQNKVTILHYLFNLLEQAGWTFSLHLGRLSGAKPLHNNQKPFEPDNTLAEYVDEYGRTNKAFLQKTRANALLWWTNHKHEYPLTHSATTKPSHIKFKTEQED